MVRKTIKRVHRHRLVAALFDVRFGSKADMCAAIVHVRYVPIADAHAFYKSQIEFCKTT
jgi:hypothetical protein